MNNRACGGWGEKEIELEVPLGLDRVVYPKKRRKRQPEPNYIRAQAVLLLIMVVLIVIAGVVV